MAGRVGVGWITVPFALMLSLSIAGIGSAWMGGCARIPFVAGLDSYMPSWLGKVHPRYATPYAALIVQGIVRFRAGILLVVGLNFCRRRRRAGELFRNCCRSRWCCSLSRSFICSARWSNLPSRNRRRKGQYSRATLFLAGTSGLLTTILGIALVFFPAQQITSLWSVRIMDVRRHVVLHRPGRIFLFRLRPPQSAATRHWRRARHWSLPITADELILGGQRLQSLRSDVTRIESGFRPLR